MKLQKLTKKAMKELQAYLQKLRQDNVIDPFIDIKKYDTEEVEPLIEVDESKYFETKLSVAKYFLYAFPEGFQPDASTWNWLSLLYYKQLLLPTKKVGELERLFIYEDLYSYKYRHLLKAPYDFYKIYKEKPKEESLDISFLLLDKANTNGVLYLKTVGSAELRKNPRFIAVLKSFFYDQKTKSIKKENLTESITRLIQVWRQYERGFDLYNMPSDLIIKKLLIKHEEFAKFIPS